MDQVIAADRQGIAVAGDDPHAEIGIGQFDGRSDRWRAAVDSMKSVGVHVIGEPAGTADA